MQKVSGQKDPAIKLLRDLATEDGRRRCGRFFAEGRELCLRAFDYGAKVECLILSDRFAASPHADEILARAADAGADVHCATEGLLAKAVGSRPVPECVAVVERRLAKLDDILGGACPLVQMVENGENADNLGMLLRSVEAVGADGFAAAGDTADPFSRKVVRGSRGAVFTVPICIQRDPAKVIDAVRNRGLQVIAASANCDTPYTDVDYTKPTLCIVGSEHSGISDTVREMSDAVVRIPMLGRINSLNIAAAASIILYEAVRQRRAA